MELDTPHLNDRICDLGTSLRDSLDRIAVALESLDAAFRSTLSSRDPEQPIISQETFDDFMRKSPGE